MKFIDAKLLQKAEGRKKGKYLLTLEVTDYDLEMIEDFATTYAPFDYSMFWKKNNPHEPKKATVGIEVLDYKTKYSKWMMNAWTCFWKCWHKFDDN